MQVVYSQTGINVPGNPPTPDQSAELEVYSTDKGVLIPRLTNVQMNDMKAFGNDDQGLLIYNTDQSAFYYFNGTAWLPVGATCNMISDEDGDTKIEVQHSDDDGEDIVKFTAEGTEVMEISDSGVEHKSGDLKTSGGTIKMGTAYSFPETDGNNGDVLSTDNTGQVTWTDPAKALGLVSGIETVSFTNVMAASNIINSVYYVRVMPWSNMSVNNMMMFIQRIYVSNAKLEMGIYDEDLKLLGSGVSSTIPSSSTDIIAEVTLSAPITLTAGKIYWFAVLDCNNAHVVAYSYTASPGNEFSCRLQDSRSTLPQTANFSNNTDKGVWIAAY